MQSTFCNKRLELCVSHQLTPERSRRVNNEPVNQFTNEPFKTIHDLTRLQSA
jgi:hypothetical protein